MIYKFLYVDDTIDEKASSAILEKAAAKSHIYCTFTVVPNLFTALECTEHTSYAAIFVGSTENGNFNASDFQRVLRCVGAPTPIIRVLDKFENVPAYVFDSEQGPPMTLLTKPYTDRQLCDTISIILDPSENANKGTMELHLQNVNSFLGFHGLDCFDSKYDEVDESIFLTPLKTRDNQRRTVDLIVDTISDQEHKRKRSSASSYESSSSSEPLFTPGQFAAKDSSSSSNSVSTDFDPDTVFLDEA